MNVLGIIAEYNPFHNGHAYQIKTLKKETNADFVIIAMSGNFVQRGAPALMDKYSRARMALSCGADLVLELPALYACASAEYFAAGGVALLERTGVVTHLGFGTETEDFSSLSELADILCREPEPFGTILREELKKGLTFPAARAQAVESCLLSQDLVYGSASGSTSDLAHRSASGSIPDPAHRSASGSIPDPAHGSAPGSILDTPNNILAVEYLKALSRCHSRMIPCPLPRRGQSYHDTAPGQAFSSASAIRACIFENNRSSPKLAPAAEAETAASPSAVQTEQAHRRLSSALEISMPKAALEILRQYPHPFLQEDDFSPLLHYKLLTESSKQLACYGDSTPDLARRMKTEAENFLSWRSFCSHLKSKNFTYTRLSRVFLHAILNIYGKDYKPLPKPSYLRVLGFCKDSSSLLSAVKAKGNLPFVTNPASFQKDQLLSLDLAASDLYRIGLASKGDNSLKNDFKQPLVLL
ncbi:MAG: nucleotidyltransferase family protein [Lachnospiraceae bacterium]|nr:nucleotidyltransferase family protein [Lachnospiraceae bacterium]